jgi:hypothetical protein
VRPSLDLIISTVPEFQGFFQIGQLVVNLQEPARKPAPAEGEE